jgi:hypothetical protein
MKEDLTLCGHDQKFLEIPGKRNFSERKQFSTSNIK